MPKAHITDISQLPVFDGISPADCTLLFDCLGCRIREYKKDCLIRLERELAGNVGTVIRVFDTLNSWTVFMPPLRRPPHDQ